MIKNEVITEIRTILIKDWDPLGIGANLNLGDEYDGYIKSNFDIFLKFATIRKMVVDSLINDFVLP